MREAKVNGKPVMRAARIFIPFFQGLEFRARGLGFKGFGLGFWVWGFGLRVQAFFILIFGVRVVFSV